MLEAFVSTVMEPCSSEAMFEHVVDKREDELAVEIDDVGKALQVFVAAFGYAVHNQLAVLHYGREGRHYLVAHVVDEIDLELVGREGLVARVDKLGLGGPEFVALHSQALGYGVLLPRHLAHAPVLATEHHNEHRKRGDDEDEHDGHHHMAPLVARGLLGVLELSGAHYVGEVVDNLELAGAFLRTVHDFLLQHLVQLEGGIKLRMLVAGMPGRIDERLEEETAVAGVEGIVDLTFENLHCLLPLLRGQTIIYVGALGVTDVVGHLGIFVGKIPQRAVYSLCLGGSKRLVVRHNSPVTGVSVHVEGLVGLVHRNFGDNERVEDVEHFPVDVDSLAVVAVAGIHRCCTTVDEIAHGACRHGC